MCAIGFWGIKKDCEWYWNTWVQKIQKSETNVCKYYVLTIEQESITHKLNDKELGDSARCLY